MSKDVEEQLGCGFNDPRRICRIDEGRGFDDSRNPRWDEGKKRKKKEEREKRPLIVSGVFVLFPRRVALSCPGLGSFSRSNIQLSNASG